MSTLDPSSRGAARRDVHAEQKPNEPIALVIILDSQNVSQDVRAIGGRERRIVLNLGHRVERQARYGIRQLRWHRLAARHQRERSGDHDSSNSMCNRWRGLAMHPVL